MIDCEKLLLSKIFLYYVWIALETIDSWRLKIILKEFSICASIQENIYECV